MEKRLSMHPHKVLSKSYMDMASKLFTFTFTFTNPMQPASHRNCHTRTYPAHTHRVFSGYFVVPLEV